MSNKTIAIIQSNYIPWKGYFDIIASVDTFVLLDEVQYTRLDWRNRNLIKTKDGRKWLSIPVLSKGLYTQRISCARVVSSAWAKHHLASIWHSYKRARFFDQNWDWLKSVYENARELEYLSQINQLFLREILTYLEVKTSIISSSEFELVEGKTERLVAICKQAGASTYLSGPGTRDYLHTVQFENEGIRVRWIKYPDYPEYEQLYPPFCHAVSIIDTILNCGPQTKDMIGGKIT